MLFWTEYFTIGSRTYTVTHGHDEFSSLRNPDGRVIRFGTVSECYGTLWVEADDYVFDCDYERRLLTEPGFCESW